MPKYLVTFVGRLKGAIGIDYGHKVELELSGPDQPEALSKLYETHEHISIFSITPLDHGSPDKADK